MPGAKERLLLAALVAGAPGAVSTDALAETLWDGDPPPSARKSLQTHVVRLRSSLEPDRPSGSTGRFVARRGLGYALTLDRGSIDALAISDLAARGHARLARGDLEEAERLLTAAVDLWRGDPYADWPEAEFAEAERRRLAEVRAGAVAGLLEARLQLGRHAEVLPDLERLVAEEPLREEWWRLLVLALYRAGRQADALAAGRRVRALLAEELGAEPGPALRAAEAAVLAQDPSLDPVARPAVLPTDAGPAPGSCPYKGLAAYQVEDAPLFHGRERLVAGLVSRLVDARLLVVSGPSGAGKSSTVRAGLVPALAGGALPGSQAWHAVIVTPGLAPVDALAALTGDPPPLIASCSSATSSRNSGPRRWTPRNAPRSSTLSWGCSMTRSSSAASWWSAATTSVGWPSTPRSPSSRAPPSPSSRRSRNRSCARSSASRPTQWACGWTRSWSTPWWPTSATRRARCRCCRPRWSARGSADAATS